MAIAMFNNLSSSKFNSNRRSERFLLNLHIFANFFVYSELKALDFDVELDTFSKSIPIFGNLTFTNIIGRLNPYAEEYVALACHYDSKWLAEGEFQAATDSAVPCAIMFNTARTLGKSQPNLLNKNKTDISLMVSGGGGRRVILAETLSHSTYLESYSCMKKFTFIIHSANIFRWRRSLCHLD